MQLSWYGTNQKRFGKQAQSDWPLLSENFIPNLDSQTWSNETSEVWTPVAGEIILFVLLTRRTTFFSSEVP